MHCWPPPTPPPPNLPKPAEIQRKREIRQKWGIREKWANRAELKCGLARQPRPGFGQFGQHFGILSCLFMCVCVCVCVCATFAQKVFLVDVDAKKYSQHIAYTWRRLCLFLLAFYESKIRFPNFKWAKYIFWDIEKIHIWWLWVSYVRFKLVRDVKAEILATGVEINFNQGACDILRYQPATNVKLFKNC